MTNPLLLLLDGNNLLKRMWYVGASDEDVAEKPYFAVSGFASYLLRLDADYQPGQVMVAWDSPPYSRSAIFPAYKANRPESEPGWVNNLEMAKRVLGSAGISQLESPGAEADDVIASLCFKRQCLNSEANILIVSSDKDLLQLVLWNCHMELLRWNKEQGSHRLRFTSEAEVKEHFGVLPSQIPDYKALAGDVSDNIPGVVGVGHKSAVALINNLGCLESIIRHTDDITTKSGKKSAVAKRIDEQAEQARMCRFLGTASRTVHLADMVAPKAISQKALAKAMEMLR